ncbi:hypothetical protein MEN41_08640 [Dolichospermum sp. ST_con]|nr:hypothetical protein [Dolichospermum sp. ST_con]MDD1420438.1 hypothetical protein [Dolichospermum sp. ST_sed1]MDD1424964.1 hypothetical protein [Dolichospermum sp. ST_sed9]MDD1433342.1 hypothetical protein [Dolichospermum sp. ST_sed6]MDD1438610.1 hypothetical protein [Dolichospermum sp. ST_sed10]MDD1442640.1 hypothetical protein [Dolichospermum sp. ST_sed3]MDD1448315.1 hypothetical protein [Dolichospermum sp. ST_sed8]MDD1453690.1 hypothetical protein [Dolichospermum sp. ST_sed7]MDD146239
MNNHQSIPEISSTTPWNYLLLEIAQTLEEYIPEILQIVRLFRQSVIMKQTSVNDWENAIKEINQSDPIKQEQRKTNIKKLFESWNGLDNEQEQKKTSAK